MSYVYYIIKLIMEKTYYSLKDFELTLEENAIERANDFQKYMDQLTEYSCKSY